MTTTTAKQLFVLLILVNCIFTSVPAQPENLDLEPDQLVVEEVSASGISWQVLTAVDSIVLKVAGKSGVVFEHRFDPSGPLWYDLTTEDGALLKDGSYKYELRVARKLSAETERLLWEAEEQGIEASLGFAPVAFRVGGDFLLADGAIDTSREGIDSGLSPGLPSGGSRRVVPMDDISGDLYVGGGLCTGADCSEFFYGDLPDHSVWINGPDPDVRLDDPLGPEWRLRSASIGQTLQIASQLAPDITPFVLERSPSNSFYLDSEGKLGLGTNIPDEELHIIGKGTSGDPTIRLEATGTPAEEYEWEVAGAEWGFFVKDVTANRTAFSVEAGAPTGSLKVSPSGNIGLGTKTPSEALHVKRSTGRAKILVEETSASTAVRTQFQLQNNGAPRFALENTSSGIEWSFQQSSPGNFLISKEGTGGPEMQVYQSGRVRMGPAGAINFDLAPSGDLTIAGSLTANGSIFPDYVFEPDYSLMPLSELRTYIQQEKRLPKLPSAEEVSQQGGHDMTELQLRLLEKIEELTLYTLAQEERIAGLEAQLKELSSRHR